MNNWLDDLFADAKKNFIEGRYNLAEPILQQMILQNTKNPEVFQMMGSIYYDQGSFNKAIKVYKRALEIDPSFTDASIGLSIILNDLGRYEEGQQVFLDAQKNLENKNFKIDAYVYEKLASKHEELADLYFQYKKYEEALDNLAKAHQLSNRKPEISIRISEVYIQMGQVPTAIKQLQTLLREYPHFITARIKLGLIYYNNNQIAEATEQWETVLVRDPKHSEALRYLKMAQAAGITYIDLNP